MSLFLLELAGELLDICWVYPYTIRNMLVISLPALLKSTMGTLTQMNLFTILVIDDESNVHRSLKRFFARYNYRVLEALNGEEGLVLLREENVDLVLLDLKMEGMDGLAVLREIKKSYPEQRVIIQTGHGGVREAVEALKNGASDFLEKGGAPEILKARVSQAYELWMLETQHNELREKSIVEFNYAPMVGASTRVKKLKDMIVRVAPTDTTVLIQGESGTGKELIARAIHHHSNREKKPFVVVDCAAISETVIESEIFGHVKGAFTGADSTTLGLIRSAEGGTLFLDEVGEFAIAIQAKFLRTIQERVVRPVGSAKSYPVETRIVAATNRNLLDEVAAGSFRKDLYYRLSTVTLTSPPLSDRGDDLELLIEHILGKAAEEAGVSEEALAYLRKYHWPGNVRELENVLRGSMVFADNGVITPADLPSAVVGGVVLKEGEEEPVFEGGTLASYELRAIKEALQAVDGNRRKASQILDISEATLYRKIKQFDL